jgi:hypothetical protein
MLEMNPDQRTSVLTIALFAAFADRNKDGHEFDQTVFYEEVRKMSAALLRDSFNNLLAPAKQLQARYLPQTQTKAGTIGASRIPARVQSS